MSEILFYLPIIVLLIISIVVLLTINVIFTIYKQLTESLFIHVILIFIYLFLTFISGVIGLFYDLDQTTSPVFQLNVLFISMTYFEFGMIYRSLKQGNSVIIDYLNVILLFAPFYALAMMLGLEFSFIPALLSQSLPLIVVLIFDFSLVARVDETIKNDVYYNRRHDNHEESILERSNTLLLFKNIFRYSRIVHFTGLLTMIAFMVLAMSGQEFQAEVVWGTSWQLFDYIYFIALLLLMLLFVKIFRRINSIKFNIIREDVALIINSIIV